MRLATLKTISKFVIAATQQLVFLNPAGKAPGAVETARLFVGSGTIPHQHPCIGYEIILPLDAAGTDINCTATPIGDKLLMQCLKVLRANRHREYGGCGAMARMSTPGSPTVLVSSPAMRAAPEIMKQIMTIPSIPSPNRDTHAMLVKHIKEEGRMAVMVHIVYLAKVLAIKVLPGPQFTGPSLGVQQATDADCYPRSRESMSINIESVVRDNTILTEIIVSIPFFSGVSVDALVCLFNSTRHCIAIRAEGMTGCLSIVFHFRRPKAESALEAAEASHATRPTKRRRTA